MLFIVVASICIISLYAWLFSQMVLHKRLEKRVDELVTSLYAGLLSQKELRRQLEKRVDELKLQQLDTLAEVRETQIAIERVIEEGENQVQVLALKGEWDDTVCRYFDCLHFSSDGIATVFCIFTDVENTKTFGKD